MAEVEVEFVVAVGDVVEMQDARHVGCYGSLEGAVGRHFLPLLQ